MIRPAPGLAPGRVLAVGLAPGPALGRLLAVGLAVAAGASGSAGCAPASVPASAAGPAAAPAPALSAPPPRRGISLGLYPERAGEDGARFDAMLAQIADVGATDVALVVAWAQNDVGAVALAPAADVTIDDRAVRRAVGRAHALGLRVLVFPIVHLRRVAPGAWRGTLRPGDVDAWWLAYERFILHYAHIAADTGADALLVGSELGSTEAWRDRWYHLISGVERVYDGPLVYSANWDHYRHVSFWRRLDAIGVTGYFELTRDRDAGEDDLRRAWAPVRADLVAYARSVGRPLWITEIGYTSTDGAAVAPWDYGTRARLDLEEQRRAYAAFAAAWDGEPALAGVFFWNWYGAGGPRDRDYTPRGKPAEQVLRRWFQAARRIP